jgi:hypothetical protein
MWELVVFVFAEDLAAEDCAQQTVADSSNASQSVLMGFEDNRRF